MAGMNLVLLVILAAIWGTAFTFISVGLESFSPILFAALRYDIAGLAILAVALARKARLWPQTRAQWLAIGVASVLNVAAYHALLFWGQGFTTPAIAAVIVGLNPIMTTVFSRALLTDERVGPGGILGLAMGLAGVVILATFKSGSVLDARGIGELAVVGAVASWAVGSTLVRRTKHGLDVFAFTAWHQIGGALLLHVAAIMFEGSGRARWDAPGLLSLLYLAIIASAIGFVIYFTLLERVGPIRVNLVSHIAPVFAAGATFVAAAMGYLDAAGFELRALGAFVLIAGGFALVARPAPTRSTRT